LADSSDDRREVEVALELGQDTKEEADVPQVVLDDRLDARILDLDGDRAAVLETGLMDLGE
jgi:hypothetical protein